MTWKSFCTVALFTALVPLGSTSYAQPAVAPPPGGPAVAAPPAAPAVAQPPVAAPAASPAASAEASNPGSPADYERLIRTALAEFDAGNFPEARASFERAHAIKPSARTLRGLGITAFELKHYVQARDELQASLSDSRQPLTQGQRGDVQALIERTRLYVGRVELQVSPADAALVLNGKPVSGTALDLDIGDYELNVSAPGYRAANLHVTIEGGKMQTLTLQLAAIDLNAAHAAAPDNTSTAAAPPKKSVFTRWWFWTAAGAVVAGVVITAVALSADPASKPLEHGDVGAGVGGVVSTLRSGQ